MSHQDKVSIMKIRDRWWFETKSSCRKKQQKMRRSANSERKNRENTWKERMSCRERSLDKADMLVHPTLTK